LYRFCCAPAATQELPTLQAILPFDTPALNPKYVSVLPGGYTYVTEEQGAIIVLQGTKLVTVIPLPPGEKPFGYSQAIAFHLKTNIGYLPNANTDNLYIIHGTEIITILRNIGDLPVAVGINQHTGLTYLANRNEPLGLTILDGTEVVTRLATSFPRVIAVDPNSAKVYIGQDISRDSPRKEQGLLAVVDATKLLTLTNLNYE